MNEARLPLQNLEWCPPGRRRKGRPRNSWMQEVTTGIKGKGIANIELINREEWRRKMKLLTHKDVKSLILYIPLRVLIWPYIVPTLQIKSYLLRTKVIAEL